MTTMPINQVEEERPFLILWQGFVPYIGQGKDDDVGGWMDGSDVEKSLVLEIKRAQTHKTFSIALRSNFKAHFASFGA